MTDRPADVGRGPLSREGLCLYHSDLLPMDCTLVGRTGCVGCLLSRRNLDPIADEEPLDVDEGWSRCPACHSPVQVRPTRRGFWLACNGDGTEHTHPRDFAIPIGQEAREGRRVKKARRSRRSGLEAR